MKKLLIKDLLGKSLKELVKMRNALQKELFDHKLKNSLRALTQTHLISVARKNIARINTAIVQKQS
jgi:ribosomal protein L29